MSSHRMFHPPLTLPTQGATRSAGCSATKLYCASCLPLRTQLLHSCRPPAASPHPHTLSRSANYTHFNWASTAYWCATPKLSCSNCGTRLVRRYTGPNMMKLRMLTISVLLLACPTVAQTGEEPCENSPDIVWECTIACNSVHRLVEPGHSQCNAKCPTPCPPPPPLAPPPSPRPPSGQEEDQERSASRARRRASAIARGRSARRRAKGERRVLVLRLSEHELEDRGLL